MTRIAYGVTLIIVVALALVGCQSVTPDPEPIEVSIGHRVTGGMTVASDVEVWGESGAPISQHQWTVDGRDVAHPFSGFTTSFSEPGEHTITLTASNGERSDSDSWTFTLAPAPDDKEQPDDAPETQTVELTDTNGLSGAVTAPVTTLVGEPFAVEVKLTADRYFDALILSVGAEGEAVTVSQSDGLECQAEGAKCVWIRPNEGDEASVTVQVTPNSLGELGVRVAAVAKGDEATVAAKTLPVEVVRSADLKTGMLATGIGSWQVPQDLVAAHGPYGELTDQGIDCVSLPGFIRQYSPKKTPGSYPDEIKHMLGLQTKQVISWVTPPYGSDSRREALCGKPYAVGSAVLVANGLENSYGPHTPAMRGQLWLTAHHVDHPTDYANLPPSAVTARITIEGQQAVRVWTNGEVSLLWSPSLAEYVGTMPVPVAYTPEPGTADWYDRFPLGSDLWAVGRSIAPVCDEHCLDRGQLTAQREIGVADRCEIGQIQPAEPGESTNHFGGHLWSDCSVISGMSGGPVLAESDVAPFAVDRHDLAIVGLNNISMGGSLTSALAIKPEVGRVVDEMIAKLKNGWTPEPEKPDPPPPPEDETQSDSAEINPQDVPEWGNADELDDDTREQWADLWEAGAAYEWEVQGKCNSGIDMRTESHWVCIKNDKAFRESLGDVPLSGTVHDWAGHVSDWHLNAIRSR